MELVQQLLNSGWYQLILIVAIIALLFYVETPLQYYVKVTIFSTITMTVATLLIPVFAFRPNNTLNVAIAGKAMSFFFKIFRIDIKVENEEYLRLDEPCIVICNHQSVLDFITLMKIWPNTNLTPLAKKELGYSGPFGLAIWLAGITFIDRLNPERARGTIDHLANRIVSEKMSVWIYPEGTRSSRITLLPLKKGAFHLAIHAQVPIVCAVTSSYLDFYSMKENKFRNSGTVRVKILPPYPTKGLTADSVNSLVKHFQEVMQTEFDQLNKQIDLNPRYYDEDQLLKSVSGQKSQAKE